MKHLIRTFVVLSAIAVFAAPVSAELLQGELGILDTSGTNPATGSAWQAGDQYRLVFVSSTAVETNTSEADNISYWNNAVQNIANNSSISNLGSVSWNIVGSTATMDARDNTSTNPFAEDGETVVETGHAIMNMDGSTVLDNNYETLWDGDEAKSFVLFDENGVGKEDSTAVNWPNTGTNWDGTAEGGDLYLQDLSAGGGIRQGMNQNNLLGVWDASNAGAAWVSGGASSVYGMSEALTVGIIPEPATLGLLLMGGAGVLFHRRRRN